MDYRERDEERIRLRQAIIEWNASRLDLFEITEPDEVRKGNLTNFASKQHGIVN